MKLLGEKQWVSFITLDLDQCILLLEFKQSFYPHAQQSSLYYGGTALHVACTLGHTDILRELIAAGADVNIHGEALGSPLQVASALRQNEALRVLLSCSSIKVNLAAGRVSDKDGWIYLP